MTCHRGKFCLILAAAALFAVPLRAEEPAASGPLANTVETLTESARKSVVVITNSGRDGKQQGLGSGFIISTDGLIATNLHVIGEGRPISVQMADGKKHEVTAVQAYDRNLDLAVVRIDAKNLPALPLGDSSLLKQGQPVVAIGNPHGLKHSVVSGIVSGTREIEGRPMIQLAIPIEPGNSGGPLLDMQGRVHGILTMKSLVTDNLGFAVAVNSLKALVDSPNPTLMSRWLTIGALDPREWSPLFGARWRQRAGRIVVDTPGQGFGGRSLCVWEQELPELPFELAVTVKLDHEEGAAGLVFGSDGGDKHFGFYPSNGNLRLVRFDGPDVFSWHVLFERPSTHYKQGDWNTLKLRLDSGKIQCFVNDQPVIETAQNLGGGKVGLAKFRNTQAEFKRFQVAKEIAAPKIADDLLERVTKLADEVPLTGVPKLSVTERFVADGASGVAVLRDQAKRMEKQAAQLRQLALSVHHRQVQAELAKLFETPEDQVDLFHAALLIARLDNDEVDVAEYRRELDRMARAISETVARDSDDHAKLAALNKYLFDEHGYHGSRGDYYHKSNSYVNEVLDDGEGLPITLSVLYIELARRLGVKVEGVGLPGHFVVRHVPAEGEPHLIDVYERGKELSRSDAEKLVRGNTGSALKEEHLAAASKRGIIVRILYNLIGLAERSRDVEGIVRYLDTIIAVMPEAGRERLMRAAYRFQTGRREESLADLDWLQEHRPQDVDPARVDELRRLVEQRGQ